MKKNYHHGNLKEELINAAFIFLKTDTLDKLTLKILSKATNTSNTAIYKHFNSKTDLIETIIEEGFKQFDHYIAAVFKEQDKLLIDRFYISGKHLLQFAKDNPNLYRILFGGSHSSIRSKIISIDNSGWDGFQLLRIAIEEAQRIGVFKSEDSTSQAIIIWASLHGLSSLIIDSFIDEKKLSEALYNHMFKSLLISIAVDKTTLSSIACDLDQLTELKEVRQILREYLS